MFKIIIPATKTNTIRAGKLDLTLDDKLSNGIKLENAIPVSDADGMKETTYTFTLKNNGTLESNYTIYLDDESLSETQTRANDGFIRYNLVKNEEEPVSQLVSEIGTNPNRVLETDTIKAGETNTYKLNIWIDKDATNDVMGTVFYTKLRIETEQSHISQVDQCFSSKVIVKGTKEESKEVIESNGYSDENINLSGEINCAEKDNYDYSYKWYKNDEQIIGEETPNLNVSENGAYKLVVTVGEKEFSSNVFNVNIDKNTPSCTLAVIEGTLISDNKYSGDIKVKMTTSTAGSSGITFKGPTTSKTASYETEVKENEIGTNDFSITEEGTYELY